jgi:hypothetical protein
MGVLSWYSGSQKWRGRREEEAKAGTSAGPARGARRLSADPPAGVLGLVPEAYKRVGLGLTQRASESESPRRPEAAVSARARGGPKFPPVCMPVPQCQPAAVSARART